MISQVSFYSQEWSRKIILEKFIPGTQSTTFLDLLDYYTPPEQDVN